MRRNEANRQDRTALKYAAMTRPTSGRLFSGVDEIYSKSRAIKEEKATNKQPIPTPEPVVDTSAMEPHLWMLRPENLQDTITSNLSRTFYDKIGSDWIAARAADEEPIDGKKEKTVFSEREKALKEKRMQKHPNWSSDQYEEIRVRELKQIDAWSARRVNKKHSQAVKDTFDVQTESPRNFADRQYRQTTRTMDRITDTLYPQISSVTSRNESVLPPVSAANNVRRIASPNTNETARFEAVRREIMAHVSAQNEVRESRFDSARKLAQVQQLLDAKLFAGLEGDAENVILKAIFENNTNEIHEVMDHEKQIRNPRAGEHMKSCAIPMREIKGFENDPSMEDLLVYTFPNKKTPESSDVKAFRKAADNAKKGESDEITADTVRDRQRLGIMVHGNWTQANKVFDRIQEVLKNPLHQEALADLDDADMPIPMLGGYQGSVSRVEEKSEVNGTEDQSNPKFRRLKVTFGEADPVEIQVTTSRDFLRNEHEVGIFNKETQKYDSGVAHDLYDIVRLMKFRDYVLPQKIYNTVDLQREAIRTMKAKAKDLLTRKKVKMKSVSV